VSSVAVVVGNYNGAELLHDCITSLDGQSLRPSSVTVVDGASTDESKAVTASLGARFIDEANCGLGYLYNRGVREAETDYVFLANNDIALMPTCLELLAATLDAHPGSFAADARQLDWAAARTIHARTTLSRGRLVREHLPGLHLDPNVSEQRVAPTLCANGAAMMVRRSMFDALNGFDETFFMEWEDLDLCWRAWYRGWSTLYVPEAVVRHRVGAVTSPVTRPRRSASSHHNLMRFALKCLPGATAARVLFGELLRLPAHPRPISSGARQVIAEAAEIWRLRRESPPSASLLETLIGGSSEGIQEALR
jgi:N-acetylglucosaminyl-diphospho-decaprenol L-rhamnosyltransferase